MNTILIGNEPGLVGYWRFDEEPGTPIAFDSSPYGNNGMLFGDAHFVESDAPIAPPIMEPNIVVVPDALNFGNVAIGGFRERILTVTNQGKVDLEVTDIFCDDSRVTASPKSFTLAMNESQEVRVRFTPTDESVLFATLTIESNDPDEGTLEIPVTGWGVPSAPGAGNALQCDGSGYYVDAGTSDIFNFGTGNFAIEAWINPNTLEPFARHFISKCGGPPLTLSGWAFAGYSDGRLNFGGFGIWEINSPAGTITTNAWQHIVVVRDGDTYKLYKDGVNVAALYHGGSLETSTLSLNISGNISGLIDEVRIWNVARTEEQIRENMNCSLTGNESGLIGYWRFDEEPGTPIAFDSSPYGNDGTLFGDAHFVESDAPIAPNDTIPPEAVTDLATSNPTDSSITLTWTAPGDDGNVGIASQNGGAAVSMGSTYGTNTATVSGCTITSNNGEAVCIRGGACTNTATVSGCTITSNNGAAVQVGNEYSTNTATVNGCTITFNSGAAVSVTGSVSSNTAIVSGCTITFNGGAGVYSGDVVYCGYVSVTDSVIKNNNGAGVSLGAIVGAGFTRNVISENVKGVETWPSSKLEGLNGNDIFGNLEYELKNTGAGEIIANDNYWGEPTTTELKNHVVNLSMIYDKQDNPNVGPVTISTYRTEPFIDSTPPSAVTNLSISSVKSDSITLNWTAPGDDGNVGTAATYDIRYSKEPIMDANWDTATQCQGEPVPNPAGSSETFTVTGLSPNTVYYFALKTADEVPNWSPLSNVAQGTTTGECILGDISGDSLVLINDAVMLLKHIADPEGNPFDERQLCAGDMDGNGVILINDAVLLLKKIAEGAPIIALHNSDTGAKIIISELKTKEGTLVKLMASSVIGGLSINLKYQNTKLLDVKTFGLSAMKEDGDGIKIAWLNDGNGKIAELEFEGKPILSAEDVYVSDLSGNLISADIIHNPVIDRNLLFQNYPNPFNPETWIPFQIKESADVTITIYDQTGHLIRRIGLGKKETGIYVKKDDAAYWDGRNENGERVAGGMYFYTITAGKFKDTKKMIMLK